MHRLALGLAVTVAAAACAHSSGDIKRARAAHYQADYAVVWNAVNQAVRHRYENIKAEDATKGFLVTDWHKIELVVDSQETSYGVAQGRNTQAARFFRLGVEIRSAGGNGAAPWIIVIDGEAALYRPGYSSLIPYKRGADDEPDWVNGRIDGMYVEIWEKLKQHEVAPSAVTPASAPSPASAPASAPQAP